MKNILFIALALFSISFSSCKDDADVDLEASKVSYLPALTMSGESSIVLPCTTTSFTDPGLKATVNGAEIPVSVTITPTYFGSSTIDGPDFYTINYQAYNTDSIPGAAIRTVLIPPCNGDLVSDISGTYTSTVVRTTTSSGAQITYTDLEYVFIKNAGGNKYLLSDAIGGYYELGRALGTAYAAPGASLTANSIPGNDFTFDSVAEVGGFGGAATLTSFTVDPASKTITFESAWNVYTFKVVLTQTTI